MSRELLERIAKKWDSGVFYCSELNKDIHDFLSTPEPEQDEPVGNSDTLLEQDEKPVAWISHNGFRFNADIEPIEHGIEIPLYLHPAPRKPFVRLSEEEVDEIVALAQSTYEAVCATENRLVRKNQ